MVEERVNAILGEHTKKLGRLTWAAILKLTIVWIAIALLGFALFNKEDASRLVNTLGALIFAIGLPLSFYLGMSLVQRRVNEITEITFQKIRTLQKETRQE